MRVAGSRGLMIQQGGLKTCCHLILESHQKEVEAAKKDPKYMNKSPLSLAAQQAQAQKQKQHVSEGMSSQVLSKQTKLELCHCVAKTLITTNPMLIAEHLRLSCMLPLIILCRDVDADNLKQFESLLAITNLTSCGEIEQNKLVQDKG